LLPEFDNSSLLTLRVVSHETAFADSDIWGVRIDTALAYSHVLSRLFAKCILFFVSFATLDMACTLKVESVGLKSRSDSSVTFFLQVGDCHVTFGGVRDK
jgi:hypothetical protein